MLSKSNNNVNLTIALSSVIIILFRFIDFPYPVITWDVFGYYLYLPAGFIYHDLKLAEPSWLEALMNNYGPSGTLYQVVYPGNGNGVIKYTLGLAILFAPFFLAGHLIALVSPAFAADGMSEPYHFSLAIGGLLWAVWGLVVLRKILLHYFSSQIAIILIITIVFGTNYFQMTAFDGTLLSHNFLFTLYSLLIWNTIKWHKRRKFSYAAYIGILCGLIILIRPSEIVCILLPLLWDFKSVKAKLSELKKHFAQFIFAAFIAVFVFTPQLIYWKYTTGSLLFYSYDNPGEGFDFLMPHIMPFLFSFRKGWLIYTPVMIFAIVGFYMLFKLNRKLFLPLLLFIIADLYVISSWTCWWYAGGSYSSRSLLPAYVILAIPLGYFLVALQKQTILRPVFYIFLSLLVLLNLFQTWQFEKGIISKERMTRAYYFAVFGKTSVHENHRKLLLVDRSTTETDVFANKDDYKKTRLFFSGYEDQDNSGNIAFEGSGSYMLTSSQAYLQATDIPYFNLTTHDHAWIEASVMIYVPEGANHPNILLVAAFHHKGKAYKYRAAGFTANEVKTGSWNNIKLLYLTPEIRSNTDNLKVYLWNRDNSNFPVDNFTVDIYQPISK